MKGKLLFCILVLFVISVLGAQVNIPIGTGTLSNSTGGAPTPYGTYYKNFRQQYLYTAAEIEAAGGGAGPINSLAFNVAAVNNCSAMPNFTIRIKETSQTALTTTFEVGTYTQVFYENNFLPVAGWNTHTFDTPFTWDGRSNILVEIVTSLIPGSYTQNASVFYTATTGTNTSLRYQSDSSPAASATTGTTSANRANIMFNMTAVTIGEPPNAAIISSPADAATNLELSQTLNWNPGTGLPTGYKLYFGTTNPPAYIGDLGSVLSYNPGTLNYSTTYYWKVIPYNAQGDATDCPVWSFTTRDDPTLPLPYLQDFETPTTLAEINWTGTFTIMANHGTSGSKGISRNLYSTVPTATATTCPIGPLAADSELKFDYRYMNWSGYPGTAFAPGAGDQLLVLVSADGINFSTVHTIDQSNHVTSTDFAPVTINLAAFSGSIYIRFDAVWATGDYYLDIDNVLVREVPLTPIIMVSPEAWDFGTRLINTTTPKEFTITNFGVGPLNISNINVSGTGFALAEAFSPVSLLTNESANFTVNFAPTSATTYNGNIAINDDRAVTNIPLTGEALDATIYAGDLPHLENFDTAPIPDFPLGWEKYISSTSTPTVDVRTTGIPNSTPNHVYIYNAADSAGDMILLSPPIDVALNTLRTKFMAKGGTNYTLEVGTWNGSAFTLYQSISVPAGYAQYSVDFSAYTGSDTRIAYRHGQGGTYRSIYVDDVFIEVPAPIAPEPATGAFPLDGMTTFVDPLLKWTPSATGEPATIYKVYLNDSGTFTEGDLIYEGTALEFQTSGQSFNRTYYWQVLPVNAHGSDPSCPVWSYNTPGESQLAESFEATAFPPAGWANGTSGNWTRSTITPLFHGTGHAYKFTSTSVQYQLSTPLLTITAGDVLDFWTRATSTAQILQVAYSQDRVIWTQLGENITYAATGVWYEQSINLSELAGNNYYLAFQTGLPTAPGSIYFDHVIGPDITPVVPGAPTLFAPANAAVNQSRYPSLSWTASTTGGVPTGYNLYLDSVDGSTLFADNVSSPYTLTTPLDWDQTYYWTVTAFNAEGFSEAPAVQSFTVMGDPTIYLSADNPWIVDFGTESGDWPVANWTQLHGFYPTPIGTTAQWVQDDWLNVSTPANKAAKINIYGATRYGWLVTPPISIPTPYYEMEFDAGLVLWNGTTAPTTTQPDDRFMVVMSDTPNMTNPTILREWNNTGSEWVFNDIPHTGANYTIPLTGISGAKYFAFYGESSVSGNGDNDLMVDNLMIRATITDPPDPVTLISPANGATELPVTGFDLSWEAGGEGAIPESYTVYMSRSLDTLLLDEVWTGITGTSFNPVTEGGLSFYYYETWYWTVMAVNGGGTALPDEPYQFRIEAEAPELAIDPQTWDFGILHVSAQSEAVQFLLSNTGNGNIYINAGDISIDDPEGNFSLNAENLPVSLGEYESYTFSVQFTPCSPGFKTAIISINDNYSPEPHTIQISGTAVEEPLMNVFDFQASVTGWTDVNLSWSGIYGTPGAPGYLHWDDSIPRNPMSSSATSYHAVAKYDSRIMGTYSGMQLNSVDIYINEAAHSVDTLKVWTGSDSDLTPQLLVYTQALSGLQTGWNTIALASPLLIGDTEALYIGYHISNIVGSYASVTDGLSAVDGRGNVYEADGIWNTLAFHGIPGSWLIHPSFAIAGSRTDLRNAQKLQIPVQNRKIDKAALLYNPFHPSFNQQRALRGFNVYRNGLQINADPVTAYSYSDEALIPGDYEYAVRAVHEGELGPLSQSQPVSIFAEVTDPYPLPFMEDWSSSAYETNRWTTDCTNWVIRPFGNPSPAAAFNWSPRIYDYRQLLTGYAFDARGLTEVKLSFDLALDNYSASVENNLAWEIWDGNSWQALGSFSSLNGDLAWTRYNYDISSHAADRVFKLRFVASGLDSNMIDYWYIDNIQIFESQTEDIAAISLSGNPLPIVGEATEYSVSVFNNGSVAQSDYLVKLFDAEHQELAMAYGLAVDAGATVEVPMLWTPLTEGFHELYARVYLDGDLVVGNDVTPMLSVYVQAAGSSSVTVGTGTETALMPFDFYYKNSLYQNIYYADEIGLTGNISALTLYNQFSTPSLNNMPVKIWMGHTSQANLNSGWIPASQLSLVFDGTVDFPAGENNIIIPLQSPFSYAGGNLVLMFNRPMDSVYYSSSDKFKTNTGVLGRALNIRSDTTVYDPDNPSGGTLSGVYPKTTFTMSPLSGDPQLIAFPTPHGYGTLWPGENRSQSFTVSNSGSGILVVNEISISDSTHFKLRDLQELPAYLEYGQSVIFSVLYEPSGLGTHAASISITDNLPDRAMGSRMNRALSTIELSGECIDPHIYNLPYSQNFDALQVPDLPPDWKKVIQSSSPLARVESSLARSYSAPNSASLYNATDLSGDVLLVCPPFSELLEANNSRLQFWARSSSSNTPLMVGVLSDLADPAGFHEVQSLTLSTNWTQYEVDLQEYSGSGKFIAFRHGHGAAGRTIYIDDVKISGINDVDLAAGAISSTDLATLNTINTAAVTIRNLGLSTQSGYTVTLYDDLDNELGSAVGGYLAPDEETVLEINWTAASLASTSIYAVVNADGDQDISNDRSENYGVIVRFDMNNMLRIGTEDTVNSPTGSSPYGTYFKNFRQQYLLRASELMQQGLNPGEIHSLSFKVQSLNDCVPMQNYRLRMKPTALSEYANAPFEEGEYQELWYQESFLPMLGWNTHSFSEPFIWDGVSNLIVDVVCTIIPGDWTYNASVYHSNPGFNAALRYHSDSTDAGSFTGDATAAGLRANMVLGMPLVVSAPRSLVAEAGDSVVWLSWEAPPRQAGNRDYGAFLGYNVYRDGQMINSETVPNPEYEDGDVTNGISYLYYVTALYEGFESLPSLTVEATPNTPPQIELSHSEFSVWALGDAEYSDEFYVYNRGGRELSIQIESLDWIVVEPSFAEIAPGDSLLLSVNYNITNLVPWHYNSEIQIQSNDPAEELAYIQISLLREFYHMTTNDNEDNQLSGQPDGDVDVVIGRSSPLHPVEFNIFSHSSTINAAKLFISAYGINESEGDLHKVYINGHLAGQLRGLPGQWSSTILPINNAWINTPSSRDTNSRTGKSEALSGRFTRAETPIHAKNLVQIQIDEDMNGNTTNINWGQLLINEQLGDAQIRYVNFNQPSYPGAGLAIVHEVDSDLIDQSIRVETQLLDPNGSIMAQSNDFRTISGTQNEAFTQNFVIPAEAYPGVYSVQVFVFDTEYGVLQDYLIQSLQVNPYQAEITCATDVVDFGAVHTQNVAEQSLLIQNTGLATLRINQITIDNPLFGASADSLVILPGAGHELQLSFSPIQEGEANGILSLYSNDPGQAVLQINLSGVGIPFVPYIHVSADSLDFGDVFTVVPKTLPLTVSNQGPALLQVWQISSSNPAFSVNPQSFSLEQDQSREIFVSFNPDTVGEHSADIILSNNSANNGSYAIQVSGRALEAPVISLSPENLELSGFTDSNYQLEAEIANLGGGTLDWQIVDNFGQMLQTRGYTSGVVDYAVIPNTPQNQLFGGSFTLSLWTKVESNTGYGGNGGKQYIISKSTETTNGFFGIYTDGVAGGLNRKNLTLRLRAANQDYILSQANVLSLNQWYHIAVTYADNIMKLYLDGELISSREIISYNGNNTAWALGKLNVNTSGNYRYCGGIDELRIWNSALSEAEIRMRRHSRLSGTEDGLVGYWSMDGGNMQDNSAYMANGTLYGGAQIVPSTVSETPSWLSFSDTFGAIVQGTPQDIQLNINTTDMIGGSYNANLQVRSNDPINSIVQIPIAMQLAGYALISISHEELDFGNVFAGEQGTRLLTIFNNGSDVLDILGFSTTDPAFGTDAVPMQLAAGASQQISVLFSPDSASPYSANLIINTDLEGFETVTVSLLGTGSLYPQISVDQSSFSSVLAHGEQQTQTLMIQNLQGIDLEYSIELIETGGRNILEGSWDGFPTGIRGMAWVENLLYLVDRSSNNLLVYNPASASVIQSFTIHANPWGICYDGSKLWIGSSAGNFYEYDLSGTLYRSFSFAQVSNPAMAWNGEDFILASSFDLNAQVYRVNPQGQLQGTLSLGGGVQLSQITWVQWHENANLWAVDSPAGRVRQFRIQGTALQQVQSISYAFNESASISHDGRDIYIAENQNGYLYRIDDGITEFNWISAEPLNGTVASGTAQEVALSFQARTRFAGSYTANLQISSNDPANSVLHLPLQLQINGTPQISCDISEIDFGGVFVNESDGKSLKIANIGTAELSVQLSAGGAFTVLPASLTLAPLSSSDISISFNPTSVQDYSQYLLVVSDDPANSNIQISLVGSGVYPPVAALDTQSISVALHNTDDPVLQNIVLSNSGGYPLHYAVHLEESPARDFIDDRFLGDLLANHPGFPDSTMGMVWYNDQLYVVDNESAKLRVFDTATNTVSISYSIHSRPSGIAWDGEAFWIGDQGGYLYKYPLSALNEQSSSPVASFHSPTNGIPAFCWMGDAFLMSNAWIDSGNTTFYKVSRSGELLQTYSSNVGTFIAQLAWVPQYSEQKLWAYQNVRDGDYFTSGKILKLKIQGSQIVKTSEMIFHDNQIAFSFTNDGRDLWYSDGNGPLLRIDDGRWLSTPIAEGVLEPERQNHSIALEINPQLRNGGNYSGNFKISSNDPLNPLLTVPITMNLSGDAEISVDPNQIIFAGTFTGESRQAQLQITNTGTDVLNITEISSDLPIYTVNPSTLNLAVSASASVTITFAPLEAGNSSAILSISSNANSDPLLQVPLSGLAEDRLPNINIATNLVNFGAVVVGNTGHQDLVIGNTGTAALEISGFDLSPGVFSTLSNSLSIPAGGQSTIRLLFSPLAGTEYSGSLVINSNDPNTPAKLILLSGLGEVGQSSIAINPNSYDYGDLPVGESRLYTFNVSNQGNGNLVINQINSDLPEFVCNLNAPLTVVVGSSLDLPFSFNPSEAGVYAGTIQIHSNDPVNPILQLSLTGNGILVPIISASAQSLDRYLVEETIDTQYLELYNTGTAALDYSISFSGNPTWLSASPNAGSIAPETGTTIGISFDTNLINAGTYQSTMQISSNDPATPILNIAVTLVHSDFNFTTSDNENNQLTGVADNDLDVYLNEYDARHPVEFNIFTNQSIAQDVILRIRANNIRSDELSQVRLNGNLLGTLRPSPAVWGISHFRVPPEYLNLGDNATNLVQINLDTTHKNPGNSMIDWGHLLFDHDGVFAGIRYFYVSSANHYPGSSVSFSMENDTQLFTQSLRTELSLFDAENTLIGTNIMPATISYAADEPLSSSFDIPGDALPGTYRAEMRVFDTQNEILQTQRNIEFNVGDYVPAISVPTALDFGQLYTGQTAGLNLLISSSGTAPLDVTDVISESSLYVATFEPFSIGMNQSFSLPISFSPTEAGTFPALLRIISNDPDSPTIVNLNGSALAPPQIALDQESVFKELYAAGSGSEQVIIRNTGSSLLRVTSITRSIITGSNWLSVSPASGNIQPGSELTLNLSFNAGTNTTGVYEAAVNIRSNDPNQGFVVLPVTLQINSRPTANFSANPATGLSPLSVQFTDLSTPLPGDPIVSWLWDFKNNGSATSTEQNPEYTYTSPGIYSVRLTVTTASGLTGTLLRSGLINAQNNPPALIDPELYLQITMDENTGDSSLNLNDIFYDPDGDPLTFSYTNHPNVSININPQGQVSITPAQYWSGITDLSFTARDNRQGSLTMTLRLTVTPVNDPPQFELPPFLAFLKNTPLVVDFAPYIFDPDGEDAGLTLQIENGYHITAVVQGTMVTFNATADWFGSETLNLTLSDGIADDVLSTLQVDVLDTFTADFHADVLDPLCGTVVHFFDDTIGNPNYWEWEFDYATRVINSYEQNPSFTYGFGGLKSVKLTVAYREDAQDYGQDSLLKTDYIDVRGTLISGNVSGTWDLMSSPYTVNDFIAIPGGATLNIQTGVEVFFVADVPFEVNGTINVDGASFAAISPGDGTDRDLPRWQGLQFNPASVNSNLNNLELANAQIPIAINGASVSCSNINISKDEDLLLANAYGVLLQNSSSSLSNLEIQGYGTGIKVLNDSQTRTQINPTLTNIRVRNSSSSSRPEDIGIELDGWISANINNVDLQDFPMGIKYEGTGQLTATTPLISNIRIRNSSSSSRDRGTGIYIKDLPAINIQNNAAATDSIVGYDKALVVETSPLVSTNATISNIRIRNSSSSSRTDDIGIELIGRVSGSINNVNLDNYTKGVRIVNTGINPSQPSLNNLQIHRPVNNDDNRTADTAIEIEGKVAIQMNNLKVDEYYNGISLIGDATILAGQTPTLTNIRIRNSSSTSRSSGTAIRIKDVPFVTLTTTPTATDSIYGYIQGIVVETELGSYSSPTLTNIRIRNSSSSSRTDAAALVMTGKVSPIINGLQLDDYYNGIIHIGDGTYNASQNPTLTNIRIRNSSSSSRQSGKGIMLKDLPYYTVQGDSIFGYSTGIEVTNETANHSSPLITNIRVRNSSSSSRSGVGLKFSGKVSPTLDNVSCDDYNYAVLLHSDGSISPAMPTIINSRFNNSGLGFFDGESGLQMIDLAEVLVSDCQISGFGIGVDIVNSLANTANPLLSNIRVRNSSSSSRTESIGIRYDGKLGGSLTNSHIEGFALGGKIMGENSSQIQNNHFLNCSDGFMVSSGLASSNISYNLLNRDSAMPMPLLSAIVLEDCNNLLVHNNTIDGYQHGLTASNSTATFSQNIVWSGTALANPIVETAASAIMLAHNNINAASPLAGVENINANPLFAGAENYALTMYSPCIDAGDPTMPLDPDGSVADLGAFFYEHSASFTANPPLGARVGDPINFSSLVVGHAADAIYEWSFSDPEQVDSYLPNPTHSYDTAGTFSITLKVTTGNFSDSYQIQSYTVLPAESLPIPENVQAVAWEDQITLSWNILSKQRALLTLSNSRNRSDFSGFNIYRKTAADAEFSLLATVSAQSTEYLDSPLMPQTYSYYVCSYDSESESLPSAAVSAEVKQVAAVSFDPSGSGFAESIPVSLICETPGALIYYTLDESEPNQDSSLYHSPLELISSSTLKARAYLEGWIPGPVSSAQYKLLAPPRDLLAFQASGGVALQWTAPDLRYRSALNRSGLTDNSVSAIRQDLSAYRIYRDEVYLAQSVDPIYLDTGVEYGLEYSYRVSAMYGDQESIPSESVTITALAETYSTLMQYDEISHTFSASIDAGTPVQVQFTTSHAIDAMVSVLYSTNPVLAEGFSNPDALGAYFSFSSEDTGLFTGSITFRLRLPNIPNDMWYRVAGESWSLITDALLLSPPLPDYTYEFTLDLGSKLRSSGLEFAFDRGGDSTLPIHLASFTVMLSPELSARLKWRVESEVNHLGYNILRGNSLDVADAVYINSQIITEGVTIGTSVSYSYTDTEIEPFQTYYYWLESVSMDGLCALAGPIVLNTDDPETPGIPEPGLQTRLLSAFPNPFNPNTNIRYSIKEAAKVKITIFNLKGQNVRTFINDHNIPGFYQIAWDGKDVGGSLVGSGVYFYRMESGKYSSTKKVIMLK